MRVGIEKLHRHGLLVMLIGGLLPASGQSWRLSRAGRVATVFPLYSLAFGNGTFVAVGFSGAILVSTNARNWVSRSSAIEGKIVSLNYGYESYTLGGNSVTFITGPTSLSSALAAVPKSSFLRSVAFGVGRFVAVGSGGGILTSETGNRWQLTASHTLEDLTGVTYDGKRFLAVGEGDMVLTSTNGLDWDSPKDAPAGDYAKGRPPIPHAPTATGNGVFVSLRSALSYSKDGIKWQTPPGFLAIGLRDVVFGNGRFVAVGPDGPICSSVDGQVWSTSDPELSRLLLGTIISPGVFAAESLLCLQSADGVIWTNRLFGRITGNVFGNQLRIHSPNLRGQYAVLTSDDGIHWRRMAPNETCPPALLAQDGQPPAPTPTPLSQAIPAGSPRLSGAMLDRNSGFAFVFQNASPSRIQASTDLVNWIDLGYATNQSGMLQFIDSDATNYPHRFYRLVSP